MYGVLSNDSGNILYNGYFRDGLPYYVGIICINDYVYHCSFDDLGGLAKVGREVSNGKKARGDGIVVKEIVLGSCNVDEYEEIKEHFASAIPDLSHVKIVQSADPLVSHAVSVSREGRMLETNVVK